MFNLDELDLILYMNSMDVMLNLEYTLDVVELDLGLYFNSRAFERVFEFVGLDLESFLNL